MDKAVLMGANLGTILIFEYKASVRSRTKFLTGYKTHQLCRRPLTVIHRHIQHISVRRKTCLHLLAQCHAANRHADRPRQNNCRQTHRYFIFQKQLNHIFTPFIL